MLTKRQLPWRNLKGRLVRTVSLMLFASLLSAAMFGGGMVLEGVRGGLAQVRSRLGADIMAVPADATNEFDAQTVLIQAEPGYFYMDGSVLDKIRAVEGVESASPQLFLASAKASCCSARLQIIGFDPETDFTVQPWIGERYSSGTLGTDEVMVGSNVTVYEDGTLTIYDRPCRIVGQFEPTGTTLDNAVYANFETIRSLIRASVDKGMNRYLNSVEDDLISSVMIRVRKGYDIEETAQRIRETVSGILVCSSANMISGIADGLEKVSAAGSVLAAVLAVLCTLMLFLLFCMMIHERAREFAALRAMGASGKMLVRGIRSEALIAFVSGGASGIVICFAVLYSFRTLIAQWIGSGFVLPGIGTAALFALCALASCVLAAVLSAAFSGRRIVRMDAALVLKEGE